MGRLKTSKLTRATKVLLLAVPVAAMGLVAGCTKTPQGQRPIAVTTGDAGIGRRIIEQKGCGACHRIPGVAGANGLVGPPLDSMGRRTFIAGRLANNEQNMIRWVMDPQSVDPRERHARPRPHRTRGPRRHRLHPRPGLSPGRYSPSPRGSRAEPAGVVGGHRPRRARGSAPTTLVPSALGEQSDEHCDPGQRPAQPTVAAGGRVWV